MKNNKEFKSTFDIIKEISAVWQELDDVTQANVANLLGGKRNANVIQALMTNFKDAEAAMQAASNAAGSALKENEQYLDSIQGKLDIMKGKFQELAMQIIGSDLVKWVTDLGNGTLDILNNMQRVHALLPMIVGAITTIMTTVAKARAAAGAGGLLAKLGEMLGGISTLKVVGVVMGVAAAVAALVGVINHFSQAQQRAIDQADQVAAAYAENEAEYNRNMASLDALSDRYHELASNTNRTAEEQEEYKSILEQIRDISPTIVTGYNSQHDAILKYGDAIENAREALQKYHAEEQREVFSKTEDNWNAWQGELDKNRSEYAKTFRATLFDLYSDVQAAVSEAFGDEAGRVFMEEFSKTLGAFDESNYIHGATEFEAWVAGLADEEISTMSENMDDLVAKVIQLQEKYSANIFSRELMQSWDSNIVDYLWSQESKIDEPLEKMSQHMQDWVKYQEGLGEDWAKDLSSQPWYEELFNAIPNLIDESSAFITQSNIKDYVSDMRELGSSDTVQNLNKLADAFRNNTVSEEEFTAAIDDFEAFGGFEFFDVDESALKSFVNLFRQIASGAREIKDPVTETTTSVLELSKAIEKMTANDKILQTSKEEMITGGLSVDTVKSISDALQEGEKLSDYLYTENGLIKLNTDAWNERGKSILESNLAAYKAQREDIAGQLKAAYLAGDADEVERLNEAFEEVNFNISMYEALLNESSKTDDPFNLSSMFSNLESAKSKADSLIEIIDSVKNGVFQNWNDLIAEYPELAQVDDIFSIDTLEGQEEVLTSLLQKTTKDCAHIIETQINTLNTVKDEMEDAGKDTTGIQTVIDNLSHLFVQWYKNPPVGKTKETPFEALGSSMEKASKYADMFKNSVDGIDFDDIQKLRDVFGENYTDYLKDDGSLNSAKMYTEIINDLISKGASKEVLDSFREMWFAIGGEDQVDTAKNNIETIISSVQELSSVTQTLREMDSGDIGVIDVFEKLLDLAKDNENIDLSSILGADGTINMDAARDTLQSYADSLFTLDELQKVFPDITQAQADALREQILAYKEAEEAATSFADSLSNISSASDLLKTMRSEESDFLSTLESVSKFASEHGIEGQMFEIINGEVDWSNGINAVKDWASAYIDSMEGIDDATKKMLQGYLEAQQEIISKSEWINKMRSDSLGLISLGEGAGAQQITYDSYNQLLEQSSQYAYALEYVNGALTINREKFDEVTNSILQSNLAEIEAKQQAILLSKEYQDLCKNVGNLGDEQQKRLDDLNAEIMGYEVLASEINHATNAFQKFLGLNSSAEGDNYGIAKQMAEMIQNVVYNKESDLFGQRNNEAYKYSVEMLIGADIQPDTPEWEAGWAAVEKYIDAGKEGLSQFMQDAWANGLVDETGVVIDSVEAWAEKLGTSTHVVEAMIDQWNKFEPIKITQGGPLDTSGVEDGAKSVNVLIDAFDNLKNAAKSKVEAAKEKLLEMKKAAGDAGTEADDLSNQQVTIDTSPAIKALGALSTTLTNIMNRLNKLANKVVNVTVNYKQTGYTGGMRGLTDVSGTGWSAAPGMSGAPGGRTLVGELGRKLFCVGVW